MVGSGRQQFRLSARIRMGWRWRRRLLVSQKREKGRKGGRGLDSPDPRSLGGVFPLFPLPPPKGGYLETNIPSPSPPAPHPPPSNALPSRRHASLLVSPFSFFLLPLPCDLYRQVHPHSPFFCVTLKKKRRGRQGVLQFFRLPSVLTLYVGSPPLQSYKFSPT